MGGLGDLDGLECRDIADGDREEGKEEREVRRLGALPLELVVVSVVPVVPRVVGRCIVCCFGLQFLCLCLSRCPWRRLWLLGHSSQRVNVRIRIGHDRS